MDVPHVVLPPSDGARADAPVVVAYHLLGVPNSATGFAEAVPLRGLDAWKVYLRLPLPVGGEDELQRLVIEDAVLNVHGPVALGAVGEFSSAYGMVRERYGIGAGVPVGVMGGSLGGAVAQLLAAEGDVGAAVLINPVVRLRPTIDALSSHRYVWGPEADEIASRIDFLRRAGELDGVPIRYITGAEDMVEAILDPVAEVVAEMEKRGNPVDRSVVPGMAHAVTSEAAVVDRLAVEWFSRHLL
jgi:pimeloyl-ACP methyl ester carboxylesterase